MRKTRVFLTEEQKEQARGLKNRGVPTSEVARIFNVSESFITKMMNTKKPYVKPEIIEVETPELGDCYNFPKQVTISEAVNENNLDRIASALERIAEVLENGRQ